MKNIICEKDGKKFEVVLDVLDKDFAVRHDGDTPVYNLREVLSSDTEIVEVHKKYELITDPKDPQYVEKYRSDGIPVYRIRALTSFGNVTVGEVGGFVQSENNLSQTGMCWVYDDSMVVDNAYVGDNAYVAENSRVACSASVTGNAGVRQSHIWDQSRVFENANVHNSTIDERAFVYGGARITNSNITGDARIYGNATIEYEASIGGDASIASTDHLITFSNIHVRDKTGEVEYDQFLSTESISVYRALDSNSDDDSRKYKTEVFFDNDAYNAIDFVNEYGKKLYVPTSDSIIPLINSIIMSINYNE